MDRELLLNSEFLLQGGEVRLDASSVLDERLAAGSRLRLMTIDLPSS
jgi:hypothetical protein